MMTVEGRPPGRGVDLCPHRRPTTDDCPQCDKAEEAAQVARPPTGGPPRSRHLIVARRSTNCPGCGRLIIAHQDRTGEVDDEWRCEACFRAAAGGG